jgi:hypothetical protein
LTQQAALAGLWHPRLFRLDASIFVEDEIPPKMLTWQRLQSPHDDNA